MPAFAGMTSRVALKAPSLPPNLFVRASETRRHALIMREFIDHRPDCELALHVKRGLEFARREQEPIDAPEIPPEDIDEEGGCRIRGR